MAKKKKHKPTVEEQLGLTGQETANELYTVYIRHNMAGDKLVDIAREAWKKKYYAEKKK